MLPEDREGIAQLLEKTPQFTDEEKKCALELTDSFIKSGEATGYDFLVAETDKGKLAGYICFGKIPLTDACYDIYWIVVDPVCQDKKIGTRLLSAAEEILVKLSARKFFTETSSQKKYLSAQNFYQKNGFRLVSYIQDYYKIGDGKFVFMKNIERGRNNER